MSTYSHIYKHMRMFTYTKVVYHLSGGMFPLTRPKISSKNQFATPGENVVQFNLFFSPYLQIMHVFCHVYGHQIQVKII